MLKIVNYVIPFFQIVSNVQVFGLLKICGSAG